MAALLGMSTKYLLMMMIRFPSGFVPVDQDPMKFSTFTYLSYLHLIHFETVKPINAFYYLGVVGTLLKIYMFL